jgi:hypothetical protein
MFIDKFDTNKTYDSIKFTASFFDQNTKDISKEVEINYHPRLDQLSKYIVPVITNQFFRSVFIKQSLGILDKLIDQKFFSQIPSGIELIIKALKTDRINSIFKFSLMRLGRELKGKLKDKTDLSLKNYIDFAIKKQVAELAFQEGNNESIMKLGEEINVLPYEIAKITDYAFDSLSAIISFALEALITGQSSNNHVSLRNILIEYPQLILLKGMVESIFSHENLILVDDFIKKQSASCGRSEEEFVEVMPTKIPGLGLQNLHSYPDSYAYTNIQEIAKLGACEFMQERLQKYLSHLQTSSEYTYDVTFTRIILEDFSKLIHSLASLVSFSILEVTNSEEMREIDNSITSISSVFGIGGLNAAILNEINTDRAEKILKLLKNPVESKLERICSSDVKLSIDDYHLRKVSEKDKEMINIPHLEFESGKVYAVKGKIGSGKTTS